MTTTLVDAGDSLPLTIPALLRHHAAERGPSILLASDEGRLSYAEADVRSQRIACGLLAMGATKGAHVGLLLPNSDDFIIFALAAARIGAVVLPFSTLSTPDELRGLLVRSDTCFLIAAPEFRGRDFAELLAAALPGLDFTRPQTVFNKEAPWLRRIWFTGIADTRHEDWSAATLEAAGTAIDTAYLAAVEQRVMPSDRLVIIHTSGSTSTPKGVMHMHGTLIRHLNNINELRRLTSDDVLFSTSPWFWIAGFAFGLLGVFAAGARIVQSNSRDAPVVLDLLERERPTITNGYGPTVVWLSQDPSFAGRDFSWLRRGNLYAIMARDIIPADPSLRHDIYGTSETGSGLSMSTDEGDLPEALRGACGKLLPGIEGKVVDPETGRECPIGEVGELWVRGPFMMEGYYGKLRSQVFEADGWWRTSDAGSIQKDGNFILKGRLGNMIKTSGANVAPREVEAIIGELTGGRLSAVFGIPDSKRGQAVAAAIFSDETRLDEAALTKQLAGRLSSYKVPRHIVQMRQNEMPTLSSGKLDTKRLSEMVQQALQSSVTATAPRSISGAAAETSHGT